MYVNEHERLSNGIEKISGIEKKNWLKEIKLQPWLKKTLKILKG
jgi:hypothetical protein